MKVWLERMLLLVLLLRIVATSRPAVPTHKRGGEILWREGGATLYRCGPDYVDICFNDDHGVRKVYMGEHNG